MSFMNTIKKAGRTVLNANEPIQRGAQKVYQNAAGIKEVADSVAKGGKVKRSAVSKAFNTASAADPSFAKQFDNVAAKDINKAEAISNFYNSNKEVIDDDLARFSGLQERMAGGSARENFGLLRESIGHENTLGGNIATAGVAASGYFDSGNWKTNVVRGAAVGGGYMGANMVGRAITGGSAGYNNQGERDIAGIPFV